MSFVGELPTTSPFAEEDFKRNLLLHFTRMHPIYGSSYVTDINLKAGAALTDDTVTLEFTTEEKNLAVAKTLAGDYELRVGNPSSLANRGLKRCRPLLRRA